MSLYVVLSKRRKRIEVTADSDSLEALAALLLEAKARGSASAKIDGGGAVLVLRQEESP